MACGIVQIPVRASECVCLAYQPLIVTHCIALLRGRYEAGSQASRQSAFHQVRIKQGKGKYALGYSMSPNFVVFILRHWLRDTQTHSRLLKRPAG